MGAQIVCPECWSKNVEELTPEGRNFYAEIECADCGCIFEASFSTWTDDELDFDDDEPDTREDQLTETEELARLHPGKIGDDF